MYTGGVCHSRQDFWRYYSELDSITVSGIERESRALGSVFEKAKEQGKAPAAFQRHKRRTRVRIPSVSSYGGLSLNCSQWRHPGGISPLAHCRRKLRNPSPRQI